MISDVMKKVMTGAEPNQAIKTSAAPGDYGAGGNTGVGATGIRPGGGGMPGMSGNTMISQGRGPAIGSMPSTGVPKTQSAGVPGMPGKPKTGGGSNKADTEKALFLAALHAAIDKVAKNPSFNLQSAVADAVAKLNALGKDKLAMDKLHHVVDNSAQAQRELKQALDTMLNTTKQIMNNV